MLLNFYIITIIINFILSDFKINLQVIKTIN